MRRVPMTMQDWLKKLDGFLQLNDRQILNNAGKISHQLAKEMAEMEYEKFNKKRIEQEDQADGSFEQALKSIDVLKQEK